LCHVYAHVHTRAHTASPYMKAIQREWPSGLYLALSPEHRVGQGKLTRLILFHRFRPL